jgi:hypothetical protein
MAFQARRGVDMSSVDQMARRRNTLRMERFTSGIAREERDRKFDNPELAFKRFSTKARTSLDALAEKVTRAEKLLEKARERSESGEIDLVSHGAEVVSAKVVISLTESLGRIYSKAIESKDIYALRTVAKAAEKLSVDADEILKESVYSKDRTVKKVVIEQNHAMARKTYDLVVGSLDNTHKELGISVPTHEELGIPAAA